MKYNLRAIVESIGLFGVIASLIFVGMQLILDRRVAMAEQYFNRVDQELANIRTYLESEAIYSIREEQWSMGSRPRWLDQAPEIEARVERGEMSVRAFYFQHHRAQLELLGFDNVFYQYKHGLIDENYWVTVRAAIRDYVQNDPLRKAVYSSNFYPIQEVVQEILNELEVDQTPNSEG